MAGLRRLIPVPSKCFDLLASEKALIDDDVINCYLRILERRNWYYSQRLPSIYAFDTFFFQGWRNGRHTSISRRTKGVNLFNEDIILFPLHLPERGADGHWSLIVVYNRINTIASYDSCGWGHEEAMNEVQEYMDQEARLKGVTTEKIWIRRGTPLDLPRQENKYDCGAFLCAYAEIITRGVNPCSRKICGKQVRKNLASALRTGRIGLEDFRLWEPTQISAHLHPDVRGTPSKPDEPINQVITFQAPSGASTEITLHWDPVLLELTKSAEEGYRPRAGNELFQGLPKKHPVEDPKVISNEDDDLLALIEDAIRDEDEQKFVLASDMDLMPMDVEAEGMFEATVDSAPIPEVGVEPTRKIPNRVTGSPKEEEMDIDPEEPGVLDCLTGGPATRPASPCLSITASENWDVANIEELTEIRVEHECTEPTLTPDVEISLECGQPENQVNLMRVGQRKIRKKKHPKRVRIYDAEGGFKRVNVRYLSPP